MPGHGRGEGSFRQIRQAQRRFEFPASSFRRSSLTTSSGAVKVDRDRKFGRRPITAVVSNLNWLADFPYGLGLFFGGRVRIRASQPVVANPQLVVLIGVLEDVAALAL